MSGEESSKFFTEEGNIKGVRVLRKLVSFADCLQAVSAFTIPAGATLLLHGFNLLTAFSASMGVYAGKAGAASGLMPKAKINISSLGTNWYKASPVELTTSYSATITVTSGALVGSGEFFTIFTM